MAQPYIGEIRCFGFNFAPVGWAWCNGQLMAIAGNESLFQLIGTTYGGDGQNTFQLPNLQGQVPMHWGNSPGGLNTVLSETMGVANVTLTINQIPSHAHVVSSAIVAPGGLPEHAAGPSGTAHIGPSSPDLIYKTAATANAPFSTTAVSLNGGSLPHDNMQPFLALNFCIATEGIFPQQ